VFSSILTVQQTFKRVAEGIATFEGIYDKLQQSTNPSQKEKLEDSLKKEIKKLQRSRDQIKAWASQNDIKDKKPLLDNRKAIETQMEKFKAVEKEMKTKAYSKEGLSAAAKLDPKEKEKLEMCEFISNMVEELERQIETFEAETDTLQLTMKKKKDTAKAERISELEESTERHKWHQSKLELLLRALENGGVDTDAVKDVEDGIKYYVESNQEADFVEDDSMYDDFNLTAEEDLYGMNNDGDKGSSQDAQSIQDEPTESEDKVRTPSISAPSPAPAPAPAPKPTKPVETPVTQLRRPSVQLKSPLPALATLHTNAPTSTTGAVQNGMKPAPIPTIPTGQPLKYASAAAAAAASDKSGVGIAPLPPPTNPAPRAPASETASPAPTPSQPATVSPSPQQPAAPLPVRSVETPITQASPATAPSQPASTPAAKETTVGQLTNGNAVQPPEEEEDESIYHLPSSLADVLESFQATKARSTTLQPLDERMLAVSRAAAPSPLDAERPNHYKPQQPYAYTPSHYPQEPLSIFDDPRLYSRIDTDTLFFSFYYRQGTYQQYLAAKALKSQSWRFHKQYQTWFQRHEEPKNITEEYEQGTYRFFDYESTWYV